MDYESIAEGYNELYEEEQVEKLEEIKKRIKVKESDLLLDVGCGTGISTNFFKCKSVGIDPSREMIKRGKGILVEAEAEHLPFKSNSFNIVLSVTALQNFKDYKKGVEEMERVSKGKIIITVLKKAIKIREIEEFLLRKSFKKEELKKDFLFIL